MATLKKYRYKPDERTTIEVLNLEDVPNGLDYETIIEEIDEP